MKKIPTLFKREFANHKVVGITDEVTPGMEWVLEGEGEATIKFDGACCAIIGGVFYKRFDAKKGRKIPEGAIPCCEPDPITGHWPHWVKVDENNPADKWFIEAYNQALLLRDGTYEAIGPHFQGNPYGLDKDILIRHGAGEMGDVARDFVSIREYLKTHIVEGIVFWKDGEPQCKIKRTDFGFEWPVKEE
ncbi:MAG: hypothetical protein IKU32_02155 [Clostridia bacterium]|nr:hypothetical protein [Clostridia bacterium]